MKTLTASWVRKAEDDLRGAQFLVRGQPSLPHIVCFHCQQSAKEYLKALLQEWELEPLETDELPELLSHLLHRDNNFRRLSRRINSLTRYTEDILYPGGRASKRQALAAVRHAEDVRREIRDRLGLIR